MHHEPESAPFRLLDRNWEAEMAAAMAADHRHGRIVCPFIKEPVVRRLLAGSPPARLQVITRFDLDECVEGVQDLAALRLLLDQGAQVRGVRGVHAKLYVFGSSRAIITSANLTEGGLGRNYEFGILCEDTSMVAGCARYFDRLWAQAGKDLSRERLAEWEEKVGPRRAMAARESRPAGLGDEGERVNEMVVPSLTGRPASTQQAFVKFQGESSNRALLAMPALEAITDSGCHWAVAYPKGKRPSSVRDGALIFIARLTKQPNDIRIFGRATGHRHQPGRDDATDADIQLRPWKTKWPHYVRVEDAEFIDGNLGDGISLNECMEALGENAFASTQRNAAKGRGNKDPRKAFLQQAAVRLSPEGVRWITQRLEAAFERHGRVAPAVLAGLDQPGRARSLAAGR